VRRALRGAGGVEVIVTGMGQDAAAAAAAVWVSRVRAVVVCGVAGGCGGDAGAGDVVLASRLVDASGAELPGAVDALMAPGGVVSVAGALVGAVASVAAPVDDRVGRAALRARGVLAMETEAAAWAAACAAAGVRLVVVRAVLDTPGAPLGVAAQMVAPGAGGPRMRDVVPVLAQPAAWPALLRLGRAAATAERAAAAAAAAMTRQLLQPT
jgi:nucleoside phosphorylase